jgi:hypothetical protein
MKAKFLLLYVVSILIIGLAGGVYWWISRPQVIMFSDDSKVILLGVDYGRHHVVPGGKLPPAPARVSTPAGRGGDRGFGGFGAAARPGNGSFNTPTDTLVAWVRTKYDYSPNQYHGFQFYVYDPAGAACGMISTRNVSGNQQGDDILAIQLDAFPRRTGKLYLRAQESYSGGQEVADGKFRISNPAAKKSYAKWTPEPLPIKQQQDDLSVTLTKLAAGVDMPYQRNQDNPDDAMNKAVQVTFHVEQGGKPVSFWEPTTVATTDATGNRVMTGVNPSQSQDGDKTVTYQYGLWPDEPAWKLSVEFQQKSGFTTNDEWTVRNIPVQPGSQQEMWNYGNQNSRMKPAFAEADLNGHHLKVFPAMLGTNVPPNSQPQGMLTVQIEPALTGGGMPMINGAPAGDGMHITLVSLVDDQGGDLGSWDYGTSTTSSGNTSSSTRRYALRDMVGVTNVNLTIALTKSHFFEFTAKPTSPENP